MKVKLIIQIIALFSGFLFIVDFALNQNLNFDTLIILILSLIAVSKFGKQNNEVKKQ